MACLEEHKQATAADFTQVTGLSGSRVRALLREMASQGIIEKVGDNRYAYYVANISSISHQSVTNRPLSVVTAEKKHAIMAFLEEHKQATAADFTQVTGLSGSRVRALLREMASQGIIEKVGDNRYAYYVANISSIAR
jgi:DNA-binding IclR family transcriptional regulator